MTSASFRLANPRRCFRSLLAALALCVALVPLAFSLEKPFDHSAWDQFLKRFVNEKGEVNYQAVKADPALLNQYLGQIAAVTMDEFQTNWPREERLAFWLNAYHAGLIAQVIRHYPVKSVQHIPGFWDAAGIRVGDGSYGLNLIRAGQLIGSFRDEKIHMVLSSGSVDGPPLMQEAFTGEKVEGQLFLQAKKYLNEMAQTSVIPGKKKLVLPLLFKWYSHDFEFDFGVPEEDSRFSKREMAILSFLAYYLDDEDKVNYLKSRNYKIRYQTFNWDLNDWRPESS